MAEFTASNLAGETLNQLASLQEYVGNLGIIVDEGSASLEQLAYLQKYASTPDIQLIGEIGFNTGISSCALLESNPEANVVSFDLGQHDCVDPAKRFIDQKYPGRHTLIKGDSVEMVPHFSKMNPNVSFGFIFIDGGHAYKTAKNDILNCRQLASLETTIVIDDLVPWIPYGVGPTKAWQEMCYKGIVIQEELVQEGKIVQELTPPGLRAWARGRYATRNSL